MPDDAVRTDLEVIAEHLDEVIRLADAASEFLIAALASEARVAIATRLDKQRAAGGSATGPGG